MRQPVPPRCTTFMTGQHQVPHSSHRRRTCLERRIQDCGLSKVASCPCARQCVPPLLQSCSCLVFERSAAPSTAPYTAGGPAQAAGLGYRPTAQAVRYCSDSCPMASDTTASSERQEVAESLVKAAAEGQVDSLANVLRAHSKDAVNRTWQPLQMTPLLAAVSCGQKRAGASAEPLVSFCTNSQPDPAAHGRLAIINASAVKPPQALKIFNHLVRSQLD